MSVEEIKALGRRWFEEWNRGKAAFMVVIDELHTNDLVYHGDGGEEIRGFDSLCDRSEGKELYQLKMQSDDVGFVGHMMWLRLSRRSDN